LTFSLAFATGVMITVSFIELLPEGIMAIGYTNALIAFFIGSICISYRLFYSSRLYYGKVFKN
jgi:zinc transporter ZupT